MATRDTPLSPRIVVVGDRLGRFRREAACLGGLHTLAVSFCDDVYLAAAELARHPDGCLAVTGPFHELTREKCAFIALLGRRGVPCCCLLDGDDTVPREDILAAVSQGARLAGGMADVEGFLKDCLAAGSGQVSSDRPDGRLPEDYRATEAEIKALLGQDGDE